LDDTELRKAGLKVTSPRIKILQMFENSLQRHLSADEIYNSLVEAGEDIGLATVYRVLSQFEAAGLITRHNFEMGNSVFELNQGKHHDHMVCQKCGKVAEFVDDLIEARQSAIAKSANFHMTDHALIIYGICKSCNK